MPKGMHALLLRTLDHTRDGVDAQVEHVDRRAERESNKVVARRGEQVPAMGRVDVEEDARHANALFLEKLLKERLLRSKKTTNQVKLYITAQATYKAVVQRSRQMLQVEPDVECRLRWDRHLEPKARQSLQNMIPLVLEVLLQSNLLLLGVCRVKQGDRRQLESTIPKTDIGEREAWQKPGETTYGWLAPPSRKDPDWESAVIRFFGPRTQHTRKPGRRQFCAVRVRRLIDRKG
jgi:hypothetical protein